MAAAEALRAFVRKNVGVRVPPPLPPFFIGVVVQLVRTHHRRSVSDMKP